MTKNKKIILGLLIGIPLLLGVIGTSNPSHSGVKGAETSRTAQTTLSPIKTTKAPLIKVIAIPTPQPTVTPRPTSTPIPTPYIAPTIKYVAPTALPATTQSSSGLSNNNYYTNINGNHVHSPANSTDGSVPAGATAKCNDETYSFSQHHSGTCSGHGGVAQWL